MFRLIPIAWWCALAIGFFGNSLMAQPSFPFFEPVRPPRKIQLIAHRGLHGLAPENSLEAVLACADDFIEWAEVDIRLTRDGQHILIHDETVDRVTTGKGRVSELDLSQVWKWDAGLPFAKRFEGKRLVSLEEMLRAGKDRVNLYLDCKSINPELLVQQILQSGMERQVIVFGDITTIRKIKTLSGGRVPVMTKFRPGNATVADFAAMVGPAAVEIDADQITPELCREFGQRGIKVQAKVLGAEWDQPEVWTRMIEAGVDWLQTDRPLPLRFHEARKRLGKFPVGIAFHRGASRYAPENTLPAMVQAVEAGADFVEIDIRTTRDQQLVLLHDSRLDRTTNGSGPVKEKDLADLRQLDAGKWFGKPYAKTAIPDLDTALKALGPKTGAYLDAKEIDPAALVAAIDRNNLWNRHTIYQSPAYCQKLRDLDRRVRTMPGLRKAADLTHLAPLKCFAVDASWNALSASFIKDCHDQGIRVFSDALGFHESVPEYRKAIIWGIDVIQTDHPLRVLRAIELEMGR